MTSIADSGPGTLRAAIDAANAAPAPDVPGQRHSILFDATLGAAPTILLQNTLPRVDARVSIDGLTLPGGGARPDPIVAVDGGTRGFLCFHLSGDVELIGLVIGDCNVGVWHSAVGQTNLFENHIGVDRAGSGLFSNNYGVETFASGFIGAPGRGNVIAGNIEVDVIGRSASDGLVVQGNRIGTDAAGAQRLNGGRGGMAVFGDRTRVGGGSSGEGNVISGGTSWGLEVAGDDVIVRGNHIGTNAAGTAAIPNAAGGVVVRAGAQRTTIGGPEPSDGNLISGNEQWGVVVLAFDGEELPSTVVLQHNLIGTNAAGNAALPNGSRGVRVDGPVTGVQIGTAGAGNTISGNGQGIALLPDDTGAAPVAPSIMGNRIGTDPTGSTAIGNGRDGILVVGAGADIGGTAVGAGNTISGNGDAGVELNGATDVDVVGNLIGTDAAGTQPLPNAYAGIEVYGAQQVRLGSAGAPNTISGNGRFGVLVTENTAPGTRAHGVVVRGNRIGTDSTGTAAVPNGTATGDVSRGGVVVQAADDVVIGGLASGGGNVISDNIGDGVRLEAAAGDGVVLWGNAIGTNAAGTADVGNSGDGVVMLADRGVVGGTTAATANTISGNGGDGIEVRGTGTIVAGNRIGTDATGTSAVPNDAAGVHVAGAPGTEIGRELAGTGNTISGNRGHGVDVGADPAGGRSSDTIIAGNRIGTDASGIAAVGNGGDGVRIGLADRTNVGGASDLAANTISGNTLSGVSDADGSTGTVVQGNRIGTDAAGTAALGNAVGVALQSDDAIVGGETPGEGNTISGNQFDGVQVHATAQRARIAGNRIGTDAAGGTALGNRRYGVAINGATATIVGPANVVSGNADHGVLVSGISTEIRGNVIGTDMSGAAALANGRDGIAVRDASGTTIVENLLSGNVLSGVSDDPESLGTVLERNAIGTTASRDAALPNGAVGVSAESDGIRIGGPSAGNVISGNAVDGIQVLPASSGAQLEGNLVGTSGDGDAAVPNGRDGILLDGDAARVGGSDPLAANVVAGNARGIVDAGTGNLVLGNLIGTDASGERALPNVVGVDIAGADMTQLGAPGAGNVISGNTDAGVVVRAAHQIRSTRTVIQANFIGASHDGTTAVGNGDGIRIEAGDDVFVGGADAAQANVIANNAGAGVVTAAGHGVRLAGNAVRDNGGLGIDYGNDGVTANDAGDVDVQAQTGPRNFPTLHRVEVNPDGAVASGTVTSTPSTRLRVELFKTDACDPSGHGEASELLAALDLTTNAAGAASFAQAVPGVALGDVVTATAGPPLDAGLAGTTSEVSACAVAAPPAPRPEPEPEPEPEPNPDPEPEPEVIDEGDVIATAIALSQRRFPGLAFAQEDGRHVVLARSDLFADALGGAVLLGDAPLLYTPRDSLDPRTAGELARLDPEVVYVLGGEQALSPAVFEAIVAERVVRLAGPSRVETAIAVADEAIARGIADGSQVAIARAFGDADGDETRAWADSISGGGWSAAAGVPLLLTPTASLHPAVQEFLEARATRESVVLGAQAAVDDVVLQALPGGRRVAGPTRFGTAAAVARELLDVAPEGPRSYHVVDGVRSDGWAYGIAAAGLVADTGAPLLYADTTAPPETLEAVAGCDGEVALTIVGPLADGVLEALDAADDATCS